MARNNNHPTDYTNHQQQHHHSQQQQQQQQQRHSKQQRHSVMAKSPRSSTDDELIRALLESNMELRTFISTLDDSFSAKISEMEERVYEKFAQLEERLSHLQASHHAIRTELCDVKEAMAPAIRKRKQPVDDDTESAWQAETASPNQMSLPQQNELWEILEGLHPKLSQGYELTSISPAKMNFTQPSEVIWCLKFVDKYWTQEEKTTMQKPAISDDELKSLAKSIQDRMVKKVQELEGKIGRQTGRYQGFGKKVRQLEKEGKWI